MVGTSERKVDDKSAEHSNGDCYNGWGIIQVPVTTQGVVRHGRNMILPVLLGAHAARRRLITPKLWLCWSLSLLRGPKGVSNYGVPGAQLQTCVIQLLRRDNVTAVRLLAVPLRIVRLCHTYYSPRYMQRVVPGFPIFQPRVLLLKPSYGVGSGLGFWVSADLGVRVRVKSGKLETLCQ